MTRFICFFVHLFKTHLTHFVHFESFFHDSAEVMFAQVSKAFVGYHLDWILWNSKVVITAQSLQSVLQSSEAASKYLDKLAEERRMQIERGLVMSVFCGCFEICDDTIEQ